MALRKKTATKRAPAKKRAAPKKAPQPKRAYRRRSVVDAVPASKQVSLAISFKPETLDWLDRTGDRMGLDAATFVRFLVERHRNGMASLLADDGYREASLGNEEVSIDLEALAEHEFRPETFPVARPGDMEAVRPVGPRANRGELLKSFRG